MSAKFVYVVVALGDEVPRILGVYTNKKDAEDAASKCPYWWCNIIKKEVNKRVD